MSKPDQIAAVGLPAVQAAEAKLLLETYERTPVLFVRGDGVHLIDDQGNYHTGQAELAARLTEITGLDRAFFSNSGTEAWEAALKLARLYAGKQREAGRKIGTKFLALDHSFHGRTMGSVATTAKEKYREPYMPVMPGVEFVPFNDVGALRTAFSDEFCAICLEAIQGEGGIRPVSQEFLEAAQELTRSTGALLIIDEIQAGLGRTGKWCAYQHFSVEPDIVTLAKPLAGGLPLGAMLCTEEVASAMQPGLHGTTFGGGPLACAVAIAVIDTLKRKDMLAHVQDVGGYFRGQLAQLAAQHSALVSGARGMGVMLALELRSADTAKSVASAMFERRILINRTSDTVLRFLPPYILGKSHVDLAIAALDEILHQHAPTQTSAAAHGGTQIGR
jgi:acetylornithine/N-succinyldiaminopimelate aminotransferase